MQTKTAPKGAAIYQLLYSYDFFLLTTPIKPIRSEPSSQTDTGRGTAETVHTATVRLSKVEGSSKILTVPLIVLSCC